MYNKRTESTQIKTVNKNYPDEGDQEEEEEEEATYTSSRTLEAITMEARMSR